MKIGKLLDQTTGIFFQGASRYLALAALQILPWMLFLLYGLFFDPSLNIFAIYTHNFRTLIETAPVAHFFLGLLMIMVKVILLTVVLGMTAILSRQLLLKRPPSLKEAFRAVKSRWIEVLGAQMLVGICVFLGFLCFVIPGLYILAGACLIIPCLLFEKIGIVDAWDRSCALIKGQRFIIFLIGILWYLATIAINGFIGTFFLQVGLTPLFFILNVTFNSLLYLIPMIFSPVVYFDRRRAKEGLDLEELSQTIEVECAPLQS